MLKRLVHPVNRFVNSIHSACVRATLPAWKVAEHPGVVFETSSLLVVDNFLSQSQFARVKEWALNLETNLTRKRRKWSPLLVQDFKECYSSRQWASNDDSLEAPPVIFLTALRDAGLIPKNRAAHIGLQRWMPGSGVGMHNDRPYATTVTLYLNEDWDARDGGHFLCTTGNDRAAETMSFVPKANRLITTRRNILHGVSRTSEKAPERLTLQVFLPYRLRKAPYTNS